MPNTPTPGIHFDDDFACRQIKNFERQVYYKQKWLRAYKTKLQILTTIDPPDSLKLIRTDGSTQKSFAWSLVGTGTNGERAYECLFDVTDVATDGVYFLYQKCELLSVKFEAISEPIHIKNYHRNVRPFVYKHSKNEFGVVWSTGIEMTFMCEADITDYEFLHDRNEFIDQVHNVSDLSAHPFREAKLNIAEARGVAPYVVDIANRVMCCDHVLFKDLLIKLGEGSKKFEVTRIKGYPLIGGTVGIVPAYNNSSLQFIDVDPIQPGIIVAYDMENGFFGTTNVVHITDITMI